MRGAFRRPSVSTVVAALALVAALAGTTYAASKITGAAIKNHSITGKDIKNGTLKAANFNPADLPQGPKGDTGSVGGLTYVASEEVEFDNNTEGFAEAVCPAGQIVTGGGVLSSGGLEINVNSSFPSNGDGDPGTTAWSAYIENQGSGFPATSTVYAICASAPVASSNLSASKASATR